MSIILRALACILLPQLLLAETFVLEGVEVVPMDRATVLGNMTVLIEDGRISALGQSENV